MQDNFIPLRYAFLAEKLFWSHWIEETNKKHKIPAGIISVKYDQNRC